MIDNVGNNFSVGKIRPLLDFYVNENICIVFGKPYLSAMIAHFVFERVYVENSYPLNLPLYNFTHVWYYAK
jgi:hypothetical protein